MDDETVCELFLEADKILSGSTGIQTKINNSPEYREYCPNNKPCSNRAESIGALSMYLFTNFYNQESGYYEHFMMWLAHNLFKIAKNRKNADVNKITLSSAYEKYLETSMGNFRQWDILNDVRGVKDTNLRYMNELYTLLKHICNIISYYNNNNEKHKKIYTYSVKCLNQYRKIYKAFSKHDSQLHLLDKLKKIYDDFRTLAIENDTDKKNKIEKRLLELTKMNEKDSHSTDNLNIFDFDDPNDQLEDEDISEIPEENNTQEEQKDHKTEEKNIVEPTKLQNTVDQRSIQREEQSVSEGASKISGNEPENNGKFQGISIETTKEILSPKTKDQALSQELPQLEPKLQPPSPEPEPQPQPQPQPHSESPPLPQPRPESPTQTESSTHPEPPTHPEPQPQTESPTQLESQPQTESPTQLESQLQIESQLGQEPGPEPQLESQPVPQTISQPGLQTIENVEQPASTQENSLTSYETIKKIIQTNVLYDFYKLHVSSFYKNLTKYGNRLYESASTSLTKGYSVFNNVANDLITQSNKVTVTLPSVDNSIQLEDSEDDLPPSDSPSEMPLSSSTESIDKKTDENHGKQHEGGSHETNPGGVSQEKEPESRSQEINSEGGIHETNLEDKGKISETESKGQIIATEQLTPILAPKDSSKDSINITYYQEIGQIPSEINVQRDISEIKVQNGIFEKGFPVNLFKERKLILYSFIVIAILVMLAVMYKCLGFGRRKKEKKKKKMKKIRKMCDENNTEKLKCIHRK
ncbi:PIR protein [Plasmodium yoelii]|uniref:PIR protein n=2 Tax=Plasmodium yoelii TaxID=5861 RepID=A0AAE9WQR0_PLAYO|nr:PIR protein [Plasmodium yoelii]WBY56990.1 PIR protein [Plasmodium yoelii yoelii]VTZ77846.1 PIR protein [Plasmodium yoelii]|eukprot:XP_022811406.2 PIR protein [Plasmodium yoelii]